MINIIVNIFKFVFWAPRVARDIPLLEEINSISFSKMIFGSTGMAIGGSSLFFILLGNEKWVQLGAYGLIVYALLGLIVAILYNQYHGEYLP